MFRDKIYTEPVPGRVYALYKLVRRNKSTQQELRDMMEPPKISSGTSYFSRILEAARELDLIDTQNNIIVPLVDLKDREEFSNYCRKTVSGLTDSQFYEVTRCLCEMNTDIFKYQSITENRLISEINTHVSHLVNEDNMRGWRLWVSFLGIGYVFEGIEHIIEFIPNAAGLLKSALNDVNYNKGDEIIMDEFMSRVSSYCRLVGNIDYESRKLNYCISSGLRTLNDQGIITLQHKHDQSYTWQLFPLEDENHYIEPISSVRIGGYK